MNNINTRRRLASNLLSLLLVLLPITSASAQRPTRPAQPRARAPQQTPAPKPSPDSTTARPGAVAVQTTQADASEADLTFDTLVAADSYGIYFEVRRIGQLAGSKEFTNLLDSFVSALGPAQELEEALAFFKAHGESLENANLHVVSMPTRPGLPQSIGALQLPTVEEAKRVEPALRGIMKKYDFAADDGTEKDPARPSPSTTRRTSRASTQLGEADKIAGVKRSPAFYFKRVGRLLLTSDAPVHSRALRASGNQPLYSNARLQAARARLATEQVFVFFDVGLMERGAAIERERYVEMARKEEAERAARPPEVAPAAVVGETVKEPPAPTSEARAELSATADTDSPPQTPPDAPPSEVSIEMGAETGGGGAGEQTQVIPPRGPTEEELAVNRADMFLSRFMGLLFGGMPVWPEAVGFGASLGGEELVVRALLIHGAGAEVRIMPFLSMLVSGPQIVSAASSVAPEDSEVFVSFSLDWQRMYAQTLGSMNRQQALMEEGMREGGGDVLREGGPYGEGQQSPEKSIEAVEKLFGFKVKEELLPALASEVAISAPLDWFDVSAFGRRREVKTEGDAKPGLVVFVSLNNPDAVRKILPRVLEAFGLKAIGAAGQTERRAGVDITNHGSVSTAFVGNYLAISNAPEPLRHVADSFAAHSVLSSNEGFRAAIEWQPQQTLAQVYVSRTLMERWKKQMGMWSDPNDAELQTLLARFDVTPRPAAYAVTSDGGTDIFHELHLPVGILKLFASSEATQRARHTPLRMSETSTIRALYNIASAQETFKAGEGKGSFATLEQLVGNPGAKGSGVYSRFGLLNREMLEQLGYRVVVSATGDGYTVHATPKEYGKSGRRSFYLDETGVVRGADHGGQPANAGDPPVDD